MQPSGAVRLSVDERVHDRHGRYGVDYPERAYFALEAPVVAEVREELVALVAAGRDVVLDHGLWMGSDREEWKVAGHRSGRYARLPYFPVDRAELLRRLAERNERKDALILSPGGAGRLPRRVRAPSDGDEEIIERDSF
ncbi:AAA family ATPase [Streptomyces sp. NPDC002566]|uniref:AAA family ATPase n=1 Tax=Streptomyces sp. NPDC002566 TaxID=3364650 RepID=UPI0036B8DC1F